ncbi:MAG: branched-chain amino acid ABC transporter permease [Candidatus Geothermarchaeales archaeon]
MQAILNGLVGGAMYALMGVGFTLIFGIMDIVNFAQGEFYMIGAYACYFTITLLGFDPILAILASIAIVFLLGVVTEKLVFFPLRTRTLDLVKSSIIVTIGLSIIFQNAALEIWGYHHLGVGYFYRGEVEAYGVRMSYERLLILFTTIITIVMFWAFLKKTKLGRAIRAVAQNKEAAQTVGVDLDKIYIATFGIGVALSGAAGALLLPINLTFPTVGLRPILFAFIVVILGGLGNVYGAIFAGFLLGLTESFIVIFISATVAEICFFVIMVVIILVKPEGLFGVKR